MEITFSKILSLLVAAGYVVLFVIEEHGFSPRILPFCLVLLFPLVLIWFAEELGDFTGYIGRGRVITERTPAILISIAGWFFLVGLPVLLYFLNK